MRAMATEPTEFTPVNIRIADPIPRLPAITIDGPPVPQRTAAPFLSAARSRPRPLMTPSGHAAKTCDPTGYVR